MTQPAKSVELGALLGAIPGTELLVGNRATRVTGLADDSRQVAAGSLFFSLAADPAEVLRHARAAAAAGAAAVVLPHGADTAALDLPQPSTLDPQPSTLDPQPSTLDPQPSTLDPQPSTCLSPSPPIVLARDCRAALADAAAAWFAPAPRMAMVGITGTNGKTTTTLMTAAVLRRTGRRVAVIGTLGTLRDDGTRESSPNTTPGLLPLYRTLSALEDEGYGIVAMEVSSQGIAQRRVRGIPFSAAVWTNLSPEHFELHGDLDTYRRVKMDFFESCVQRPTGGGMPPFRNVLNGDDPEYSRFRSVCRGEVFPFGIDSPEAAVRAHDVEAGYDGCRFVLEAGGARAPVRLSLGGGFNVQNALAAAAVGLGFGLDVQSIAAGLESVREVPGRFQALGGRDRRVLVDYAHTSEGMEKLLASCRDLVRDKGRLIVVFGCGGERDRTKRPRMGAVTARLADLFFVTNDNPRREDPKQILADILTGIPEAAHGRMSIQTDRADAIRQAIETASPDDLVVVAGKGHEDYQILGERRIHFDDREVVREALARREQR